MKSTARFALAIGAVLALSPSGAAEAGNGDEFRNIFSRHYCHCVYGDPRPCHCKEPRHPCRSCQMSWQPIRSLMHPNMMPAGMIRPWPPLNLRIQSLLPKTPLAWLRPDHPWTGCKDGRCWVR